MSEKLNADELSVLETTREFLGREFLTWLWFKSEIGKNKITIPNYTPFDFYVDDKIILSSTSGSVKENSLKGETPGYSKETAGALIAGKMVKEIKFVLQNKDFQFFFTISANDLSLKTVKMNSLNEQSESSSIITERILLLHNLNDIIDTLYKEYMSLRLSPKFIDEVEEMRNWIKLKYSSVKYETNHVVARQDMV